MSCSSSTVEACRSQCPELLWRWLEYRPVVYYEAYASVCPASSSTGRFIIGTLVECLERYHR